MEKGVEEKDEELKAQKIKEKQEKEKAKKEKKQQDLKEKREKEKKEKKEKRQKERQEKKQNKEKEQKTKKPIKEIGENNKKENKETTKEEKPQEKIKEEVKFEESEKIEEKEEFKVEDKKKENKKQDKKENEKTKKPKEPLREEEKKALETKKAEEKAEKAKKKEENKAKRKARKEAKKVKKAEKKANKRRGSKAFLIIVLILVLTLVSIIGVTVWYVWDKLNKVTQVDINIHDVGMTRDEDEDITGYRNIVLFGVDSREDEYSIGNRSDCIIILSINNQSDEAKVFSVYRDTYLDIQGHGLDKLTHAYSYGEAPLTMETLNNNLDLNIKEFVAVNFNSLASAINKIGGVTIDVKSDEINYLNQCAKVTSNSTGIATKEVTATGPQKLDGVQAVAYSRIRSTEGGDYKRTERMRTVLVAMMEEAKNKSIFELTEIANEILPHIYTNVSPVEILSLLPKLSKIDLNDNIGWPYESKGITFDRWYGVPVTLESNVERLHKELFGQEDYIVPDNIKEISNRIIEKTGYTK